MGHQQLNSGAAHGRARNQFVTTNEQNLGFGYGRHACPGKFFAANEVKMILARLLVTYDVQNADGFRGRYENHMTDRLVSGCSLGSSAGVMSGGSLEPTAA